jgi:hypothetical protein
MTSGTYTYGALTSQLTSVQTVVDSVLGTMNSVKLMTSFVYTKAPTNNIMGASDKADHDDDILDALDAAQDAYAKTVSMYASLTVMSNLSAADVWAVATRSLTDSVARTSQLTSVQLAVDAGGATLTPSDVWGYSVKALTDSVARTSQLTSVQLAVDAGAAGVTVSQVWEYSDRQLTESVAVNTWAVATRSLTDSVARTSQLTSVQLVIDAGGAGVTTSQIWEYSDRQLTESVAVNVWAVATRSLTDSVARTSQLASVQLAVDTMAASIAALNNATPESVWAVATRSLTDSVARTSQLTSVQTVVDSVIGTLNSVKAMTSNTYTYGALTSQLTSVQLKADSVAVVLGSLYDSVSIMSNAAPADVWAVATRSLTDSVARASQLTSVQAIVDSTYQTAGSVLVSLAIMSNLSAADMWAVATRSLTDSVARTSQLTSVQTKVDTLAAGGDATLANQTSILLHLTDIKGATWAAGTDSLEAIRDRGDAAWITGAGLTGANTVTLTIKDDSVLNVVEAAVAVYDLAGTTFYEKKFSNSSGQTTFQMDDGTYIVKVHKAGYSWDDTTIVIAGATTQTITGTASTITPPADPTLCRIGIYIKYQDGTIPASVDSSLEIVELPDVSGNIGYLGTAYDGTYSATTGFLYWDVIQGAIARLYIHDAGIDGTKITIPATDTAEIEDLI